MHVQTYKSWYSKAFWRTSLRPTVLARDPVCMECHRYASTHVDHIKPHCGNYALFCDLNNLQGLCEHCHNKKTAKQDGGFGNAKPQPQTTFAGQTGSVTAVGKAAIDKALGSDDEIAALLAGV